MSGVSGAFAFTITAWPVLRIDDRFRG